MKNYSFMKRHILILILIFVSSQSNSQNLIPNAGFEHKNDCPTRQSHSVILAKGWTNPTKGTPDYYHSCGDKDYKTPKNQYGIKKPYHGDSYVGLNNRGSFREYIRIRLTKTLKKGYTYRVKMHVSASKKFDYSTSDIGFFFSSKYKDQNTTGRLQDCEAQITNPEENIIPANKWVVVSGKYIAKGGEKFVTIGSFRRNVNFHAITENASDRKNSYIFIDNLSTVALKRPKGQLPPLGKLKTLNSIFFDHDKFILKKESYKELNELAEILSVKINVKIEIIGHTDNSGSKEHNLTLSKQRAKAVASYLIKKGISKERIKHKGVGSNSPTDTKNSEKAQQLNRRVEFRVIN